MQLTSLHLSRSAQLIVFMTLCITIEGVLLGALIAPSVVEIRTLRREVDARRRDLESRFERGAQVNTIRATYQELAPSIEEWQRIFLGKERELALITELETLAGRHGVTQILSLPKSNETLSLPPGTRPLPLQVSASGAFPALLSYFRALEQLPIVYSVQSWEMAKRLSSSEFASPDVHGASMMRIEGILWQRDE